MRQRERDIVNKETKQAQMQALRTQHREHRLGQTNRLGLPLKDP